jgi:hypothetical protein
VGNGNENLRSFVVLCAERERAHAAWKYCTGMKMDGVDGHACCRFAQRGHAWHGHQDTDMDDMYMHGVDMHSMDTYGVVEQR